MAQISVIFTCTLSRNSVKLFVVSVLVSMSLISLLLIICVFIMMHVAGKKKPPPKYHVHANQPSA